ncbi:MAG: phenylacetate--CoA ligase family protein [Archaeoglobaceae archaeon]|nr:phenylacetate--CoA ligase family protein [Archaeoglobaceae archaeon]MDW8128088.1 phenylacetate--CoA ligase family protein [Archaeoglobaceae archaeon]
MNSGIYLKRQEIEEIKRKRLKNTLKYVYENCSFYRRLFEGIDLDRITPETISKLPFTTKQDLRNSYPLKMSCVPKEKIVRIQMSGGTTGQPVIVPYTRKDVEQWKEMMLRAFQLAEISSKDVIQITPAFGLWNGGFGFHFAADEINAFVIPIGAGNTRNQIRFMLDFSTTVLCATASYPLRIAEVAEELGYKPSELPVEKMILGAEPWSDEMRKRIEELFEARTYDIPGLTEMGGVGTVGFECPLRKGLHMWEDNYIVEVVDPKTGETLEEGEEGEVVYTAINREAMPLIRYRSGEISEIISKERCECGIEHLTLKRIKGRTDDMIIHSGAKFYPSDVERILASYGITQYKIEVGSEVRILFEGDSSLLSSLKRDFREFIGINPELVVVSKGSLERFEGKAKRLVRL